MSEVRLEAVRKSFGAVEIIKGVDLDITSGEFVVFVGPSGCGKSTLLRIISGLESASAGRIFIDGRDVTRLPPGERQVAMVFQSYALYPHMSVRENMSFGLRMTGAPRGDIEARVAEAARILQIEPLLERKPKQLSGGQRQRVAIGRAIVRHPKVFLFDEPLSNLDAALRVQMRVEIARLHAEIGATMIYVTHDQVEAMTLADRIVVLNHGEVEQIGTPLELYEHPANRFVAGFLGQPRMNFLDARIEGHPRSVRLGTSSGNAPLLLAVGAKQAEGAVSLGIRPDAISLADERNAHLVGIVEIVEHLGAWSLVYAKLADAPELLTVELHGKSELRHADPLFLKLDEAAIHLFDTRGQAIA